MALPLKPGLTPAEVAFLCEMEMVTVIPRQRLDSLELLGGPTKALVPPFPTPLPLWLALLLKRQRRANILPPPWLNPEALSAILDIEVDNEDLFSPPLPLPGSTTLPSDVYLDRTALEVSAPFLPSSTSNALPDALPYHWLELSHMLLSHASDDFEEPDAVRGLLRDLKEVRMAKLRKGLRVLDAGAGVQMNGVGALEIAESRTFIAGVIDGLRRIGASREQTRKERDAEDAENGYAASSIDDQDDDML
ncbi:GINS complex, PSF2 component [Aureobasidium sp. EXF-8845]|nr:GINS complex, PSF2 component [Aureobasidium sp. EXF-8845]KAI4847837.1 GINS complex, PSF2 component [Aureobasidium sp. EXF-8846]